MLSQDWHTLHTATFKPMNMYDKKKKKERNICNIWLLVCRIKPHTQNMFKQKSIYLD